MSLSVHPRDYPVVVAYLVNLVMGIVVSFDVMTVGVAQSVTTAVVAATSLVVVLMTRPVAIPAATGAFQTFIVAVGAFGFHLRDEQLAALVGVFGVAVALLTHQLVTPLAAARQGATVAAQEAARANGTAQQPPAG